jgi:hypothetical protein
MVALARQMLFMASSFNTAVLVTNHLVKGGSDDSGMNPTTATDDALFTHTLSACVAARFKVSGGPDK